MSLLQEAFQSGFTGVCKINGVVAVVDSSYSIGFSTANNNKNTVFFANTGRIVSLICLSQTSKHWSINNSQWMLLVFVNQPVDVVCVCQSTSGLCVLFVCQSTLVIIVVCLFVDYLFVCVCVLL